MDCLAFLYSSKSESVECLKIIENSCVFAFNLIYFISLQTDKQKIAGHNEGVGFNFNNSKLCNSRYLVQNT